MVHFMLQAVQALSDCHPACDPWRPGCKEPYRGVCGGQVLSCLAPSASSVSDPRPLPSLGVDSLAISTLAFHPILVVSTASSAALGILRLLPSASF